MSLPAGTQLGSDIDPYTWSEQNWDIPFWQALEKWSSRMGRKSHRPDASGTRWIYYMPWHPVGQSTHTLWTHHRFSSFSLKLGKLGRLSGCSTFPNRLSPPQLPIKCLQGPPELPSGSAWHGGRHSTFLLSPGHIQRWLTEVVSLLFEMSPSYTEDRAAAMWYCRVIQNTLNSNTSSCHLFWVVWLAFIPTVTSDVNLVAP